MMDQQIKITLAEPRGFCAGVERAISIVEQALHKYGTPVYVRHEVVHNRYVCDELRQKGAVFVENIDDIPRGSTVIFSAHGVAKSVREEASNRGLRIFDATCPLVTKVHVEVGKMRNRQQQVIMIGHKGHPEVAGTMGQAENGITLVEDEADVARLDFPEGTALSYVTQTTLSVDDAAHLVLALKARFPSISGPKTEDICYATQNRQDAVKELSVQSDVVIVVGSPSSSNSNRLREVAEKSGCAAYMVESAMFIEPQWLFAGCKIGVTAGASAPEILVKQVVERLRELGADEPQVMLGKEENVKFSLPKMLREP